MLREIKAKGGYIYDYGEQTDDPAGADDPGVSGADVCGLSRQPVLGAGRVHRGLPDGLCRRLHRPAL